MQLREEVRRIQLELGITTLYVTHDQEEALSISDRVAVMSQGRVEQLGTPAEIYSGPRTAFVANFVGTMNKLEGTVASALDRTVRTGPLLLSIPDPSFNHPVGETVELFLRPEDVSLEVLTNGDRPAEGLLEGRVTSLTFLGPVTRGRPGHRNRGSAGGRLERGGPQPRRRHSRGDQARCSLPALDHPRTTV